MTSNYRTIMEALDEIRATYRREIMRWYRIRRYCRKRGLDRLAERIMKEIQMAERELTCNDYRDWDYAYEFLFQLDNPYREGRYLGKPLLADWDGE